MRAARLTAAVAAATLAAVTYAAPAHAQSNTVSTVAGTGTNGLGGDGGPATGAQLSIPIGIGPAFGGGFLIAEQGASGVRGVLPNGTIFRVAGSGTVGTGGDGGPATAPGVGFSAPSGAAMLPDGTVLIADTNNNRIRAVATDGTLSTVVGSTAGFSGDNGAASSAQINFPVDIAVRADGSYLIADTDNNRIRQVAGGVITTVAGSGPIHPSGTFGGDEGPATSALIHDPSGVALMPDGGFVLSDAQNHRVRRVFPDGTIDTVAGNGIPGFSGDGGPATAANLNGPRGLAVTSDGSILFADLNNNRVRRIAPDGTIATVVGTGTPEFNGDGAPGPATSLNGPFDVMVNAEGDYLIADTSNERIRLLDVAAPAPPPPPPQLVPGALVLDPTQAERRPGDTNVVTATVRNTDGSIAANRLVRFTIAGPNAGAGSATTDARGIAQISWEGIREGTDALSAFVDTNGNSVFDLGEPTAQATVTWALPIPVQGRVFNVEPVSGIVKIRVIRRGKDAHAAGGSFTQLAEAQQVPITTEVDVTKGRVRMTLAADRQGNIQKGEFYSGVYTTRQPRTGSRAVTELRLSERLTCRPNRAGKVTAAAGRSRRLWGNGRGRFRTRGRHSAATVRGTIWLTKDSCNATTTTVRQGSVIVNDFAKKKNVRVKRGRSYTARARRR
jgi:sugar lactone lactonase YvrE